MSSNPTSTPEAATAKSTAGASVFILVTVAINSLGLSIIIPVLPDLLMELASTDVAGAAIWGGLASFVFAVMQFLCSPVVGGLSDRFGRRPVLLLSLAALALDFLLMGLAHALWVFFFARLLSGIFAATNSTANAYMADITSEKDRATRFGWIGAAFGIGFVLGPAIGGQLGEISARAPFFAAAALAALNAAYGYFAVPESLPKDRRRPFEWSRANPFGTLAQLRRIDGLSKLVGVYFLTNLSGFVYPVVWSYVAIAKFEWSAGLIGWSIAFYGICFAVSQAVVVPIILKRMKEERAIQWGLLVECVALVGIATAPNTAMVFFWISTSLFSSVQSPILQKLMTSKVRSDQQGELQGGLSALMSVILMISPLIYPGLLFLFDRGLVGGIVFPGMPFILAALFNVVGFWLMLSAGRELKTAGIKRAEGSSG